jgi:hypothetical protein
MRFLDTITDSRKMSYGLACRCSGAFASNQTSPAMNWGMKVTEEKKRVSWGLKRYALGRGSPQERMMVDLKHLGIPRSKPGCWLERHKLIP